jgi:hypothetical protein
MSPRRSIPLRREPPIGRCTQMAYAPRIRAAMTVSDHALSFDAVFQGPSPRFGWDPLSRCTHKPRGSRAGGAPRVASRISGMLSGTGPSSGNRMPHIDPLLGLPEPAALGQSLKAIVRSSTSTAIW